MNKRGIVFNITIIIILIIIIILMLTVFVTYMGRFYGKRPYTLCTENYEETDNYLKVHKIEIGKRWEQENKICYETYDKELYNNLINFTSEQERERYDKKLELEDKKNQRKWDFLEKNKFYIFIIILVGIIFWIYMKYKKKEE